MNNQIQLVLKSSTAEMPLNDQALGIYLTPELDGLVGLPEIRTTSGVNAGYDGGWTSAQNYDARSITIRGVIANENVATVERLRKQLVSLAGQGKREELTLDLVTEAGNAYTLQVRTIALEMSMQSVLTQQQFMLQLRADDPLIYDAGESEHEATLQVAKATGGFTIDFELPLAITGGSEESVVNNDGLEEVPTIVKMYGALHNPKIINQTNNEQMQIMADLGYAEGAWHTPSEASEGTNTSLANTPDSAPFSDIKLKGDTAQNGTPTPSAPVAVQTVTGENVVKICGKNLLNTQDVVKGRLDNGVIGYASNTTSLTSDSSSITFTIDAAWRGFVSKIIPAGSSTTYSVSGTTGTVTVGLYADFYSASGWLSRYSSPLYTGDFSYSFTTPTNCTYIRLSWQGSQAGTFTISNPQLELGNQPTAYEPYQGQSYEVNLASKNMLDIATLTYGYVLIDGGFSSNHPLGEMRSRYIKVDPSTTYTFSIVETSSSHESWFGIGEYSAYSSGFIIRQTQTTSGATSFTFTTSANCQYVVLSARNLEAATKVQFEKTSTPTSWEAFWQIELCKIGTYQDYIYKSGGDWYVHKKILKMTFDSSATGWIWDSSIPRISYNAGSWHVIGPNNQQTAVPAFSNKYVAGSFEHVYTNKNNGFAFSPSAFISCVDTSWTSEAQAKATIDGIIFYFALQEAYATDTKITNEALIAQLDDLLNLSRTYQGQTNLSDLAASGNMPAILNVSYFTEQDPDTRDELIIDSRLHTVTLNGLDIYHLIGEGSEFLMLEPGENRLSLQSDITGDNGYAVVSYKQGYLSI